MIKSIFFFLKNVEHEKDIPSGGSHHVMWVGFMTTTRFFEEVDSQLPLRLMMLIRQPLKMKNGCELTKNRRYTIFEPLLQLNKAK